MNHKEKIERLACSICGKQSDITLSECYSKQTNPLCREYETCRIAEKSEEQLNYVLSSIENCIFLKACPGSGKTEAVGLKSAFEMMQWDKTPGGIAVLTFTKNAAKVIEQRAVQFAGMKKISFPHFIGTIDSWLHGYIAHPFAHTITGYTGKDGDHSIHIIDNDCQSKFLNHYKAGYSLLQRKVLANQFHIDVITEKVIFDYGNGNRKLTLEPQQVRDLKKIKRKFEKSGFATYQDIEHICYRLLSNAKLAQLLSMRFPLIIVDECQDLSEAQIQSLDKLKRQGTILHFVGDLNQAIYEFKKVIPENVKKYTDEEKFNDLSLSNNYRSCQPITNLCTKLVNADKVTSAAEKQKQEHPCICLLFQKTDMMTLSTWFINHLDEFDINKQNSAIVTRSQENVSKIKSGAGREITNYQKRLAMAIHLWIKKDRQVIDDALQYLGRFVREKFFPNESINARNYYQPEFVCSGIKWRLFLTKVLDQCRQDKNLSDLDKTWTDWAKLIKTNMPELFNNNANVFGIVFPRNKNKFAFTSPKGEKNSQVLTTLPSNSPSHESLRITTIHDIKGETLEALMLVSSPSSRGTGHWEQWLDNPLSETARLAYVASSRPRQLLVWAIPNTEDYNKLTTLGFHVRRMPKGKPKKTYSAPLLPEEQKQEELMYSFSSDD